MNERRGRLEVAGQSLAWRALDGTGPTLVWLGGFRSEMTGTKASALAEWAARCGRGLLRFDYAGQGESSGRFEDGTIGRWRGDALAVLDALTDGPVVLVGSSMGGWIAGLVALARPDRVAGLVLLAPAPDFTEMLMRPSLSPEALGALEERGAWDAPSEYGGTYPITRALLDDGRDWRLLPGPVPVQAPVRILQGTADADVPWGHALQLAEALESPDVVFTLIKGGDHRLSRPQDLARLFATIEELTGPALEFA
jgi:pimeloyl-ACP methyl ester carboxylesterase